MTEDERSASHDTEPPAAEVSAQPAGQTAGRWATRGVFGVGSASLFSDAGHEMVTSVLPTFLTSTLHAGPASLGVIDGVSDALTGLCKLAGGPIANDRVRRAKRASGGYLGTAIATAAIGVATAVWRVAILRVLAWASRGVRSPARDMLLTELSSENAYGRAFGVERAGDNAGAIVGPLVAAVAITIAAREARRTVADPAFRRALSLNLRQLWQTGLPGC